MTAPSEDVPRPIQEHVIELLIRLRKALISVIIASLLVSVIPSSLIFGENPEGGYTPLVLSAFFYMRDSLLESTNRFASKFGALLGTKGVEIKLIAYGWLDAVEVMIYLAILLGFLVTSPYVGYQIYSYLKPALFPKEKKLLLSFSVGFAILFLAGAVYAYYLVIPATFAILAWINLGSGVELTFSVKQFFNFVMLGMVSSGLFFTFPLAIALAAKAGVVRSATLKQKWRIVFFVIAAVAAILTPDPTPVSTLMLTIPFFILYGLATLLASKLEPRPSSAQAAPSSDKV